jgi:hypothetical protein
MIVFPLRRSVGLKAATASSRVRLRTLEEWLLEEAWHKRARHVVPPKAD